MEYELKKELENFLDYSSRDKLLYSFVRYILNSFSLKSANLLRYSAIDHLAEGMIYVENDVLQPITHIRDNIRSLPAIFKALLDGEAKFYEGVDYYSIASQKYVRTKNQQALIVIPVVHEHHVMGYICSSEFLQDKATISNEQLKKATLLGKILGQQLTHSTYEPTLNLSKRELEVMKNIAEGFSTKEVAQMLNLSEVTIKQYVKQSISKLGALNRTHAVSILFRKKILT
jgi:DNA-binding CsgD family transcriptional regulator